LVKTGTGTQILSGTNTYDGTTIVSAGKLLINGDNSNAKGAVTVAAGATLGGNGTIGGITTINGTHAVGNSIGEQTFSSNLIYGSGSTFSWELGSQAIGEGGVNFDSVVVGGNLTVNGGNFNVIVTNLELGASFWDANQTWSVFEVTGTKTGTFSSFNLYDSSNLSNQVNYSSQGSFSFNAGNLTWTAAIPEPTNALAGLLIGAGLLRRRRSAK
jgi:autotransporter-associated beta strand protein